ncbi:hypothetical protein [Lysinibacillus xylanilyticus]|uniref:hypothetical protein n=1 Tax=Lysinibacillus xylanilyticus TaxID=582475 RepID=UPI003D01B57E
MYENQKMDIINFYRATQALKDSNVIRSSKYTGDIAEFLCSHWLGIKLESSQNRKGFDGIDPSSNNSKVQIKYHGAETGTNIDMRSYKEGDFDDLYVVLSPNSTIRPDICSSNTFAFFKIKDFFTENKNGKKIDYIATGELKKAKLMLELDEKLEKI